jgi:hypothetical protein
LVAATPSSPFGVTGKLRRGRRIHSVATRRRRYLPYPFGLVVFPVCTNMALAMAK